jgi:hydroxyethylthiazole kinase
MEKTGGIMLGKYLEQVRSISPLVHNITNYVTVNDCANITLACGASPIMAEEYQEAAEITSICNALVINIGTLTKQTIPAMLAAGKKANDRGLPVVLDPVGIGASQLRTNTVIELLQQMHFTVIRGNVSEMKKVYQCYSKECKEDKGKREEIPASTRTDSSGHRGVDASVSDLISEETLEDTITLARALSKMADSVIVITGAIDIVAADDSVYVIRNGHPMMSKITGSGCMLTSLLGAFCGANAPYYPEACAAAVCAMGIAGEQAYRKTYERKEGTGAFRMYLIDAISTMQAEELNQRAQFELVEIDR